MERGPRRSLEQLFGGRATRMAGEMVRWQLVAAGFLTLQAVAVVVLSVAYTLPLSISHLTGDTLQTQLVGRTVVGPAVSELFPVNIAYILAVMLVLTGLIAVLLATVFRERYIGMLKDGWQPVRWLTLVVAGSIMVALLAFLGGVHDLPTLGILKALVVVACVTGLMGEVLVVRRVKPRWLACLAFITGGAAIALAWLVVLLVLIATNLFGSVPLPGYIWWLLVTIALSVLLVAGNVCLTLKKHGKWANYIYSEGWLIVVVVAAETAFVWQVFAAVLHP